MTGTILAGGENLRIPLLKGRIEINGARIIDFSVRLLSEFFSKVVISTNAPEFYFYCGVPMVGDLLKQRGPLTGIFSVLAGTGEEEIFVVACDMPFIKPELVRYVIDKYEKESRRPDAIIPVFGGMPQPLFGIYSKNILPSVENRLNRGLAGIRDALTEVNVMYIKEEEVEEIDSEGKSFVNINTMEDYKKVISGGD